jgi:hypothetical protein
MPCISKSCRTCFTGLRTATFIFDLTRAFFDPYDAESRATNVAIAAASELHTTRRYQWLLLSEDGTHAQCCKARPA